MRRLKPRCKSGENALLIKTRNDNADHIVSRIILIVIWQQLLSDHILILPMSGSFENAVFAERIVSDHGYDAYD